ncbi:MAG: c-type cytochrome, partial [Bacteroidota bacterium]
MVRFISLRKWIWTQMIFFVACDSKVNHTTTFNEDIAPIIFKNCTPCHHPGAAGPFNLLTYEDVVTHAANVRVTIISKYMPPWPADPNYRHFAGEKVLSESAIRLICEWMDNGMPEGDDKKKPEAADFNSSMIGKPDLTLRLSEMIRIPGDNKDRFLMMKVPIELEKDTFVRLIEIVPDNRKLVHHINGHLIRYEEKKKKDLGKGSPFVDTELHDKSEAYQLLRLPNDDGTYPVLTPSVTNYLTGVEPATYPEGIGGYRLSKKSVLLLDNIHYGPSPIDTTDRTTFNLFYQPVAPKRPTKEFILGTSGISPIVPPLVVQAGKKQSFRTQYVIPEDISLLTINPHMHLLGSSFKAYALAKAGDTIPLINIPRWDFRWQYFYTFEKIIHLPQGTTIVAEGIFDNTENNPLNPFNPPRT